MSKPDSSILRKLIDSIREDELQQRLPPVAKEPITDNPTVLGRKRRTSSVIKTTPTTD